MIKKRMMQGVVAGCVLMAMGGGWSTTTYKAAEMAYSEQMQIITVEVETGNTRESGLVWYFKEENGKKYRRLYDMTNQVWLTDWILCE